MFCSTLEADTARERIRSQLVKQEGPSSVSIEQQRKEWDASASQTPLPDGVTAERVVANGVPGMLLVPRQPRTAALVIHVHGGGFILGSSVTHRDLGARLALASQTSLLLIDYRLAPEHPYPAARDDVLIAYRWALNQGYEPKNIAIAGDSAGAHVALSAVLELESRKSLMPIGLVLISPWLDLAQSGQSMRMLADADPLISQADLQDCAKKYLGEVDPTDSAVALLQRDLRGLPRTLVHVGADEILLSDSERFAQRARSAGNEVSLKIWPKLWHVFHTWAPDLPEANDAVGEIGAFIRGL